MRHPAELRATHDIAEGEENAAEQHYTEEQADQMPAFENPVATAAFSVPCHCWLLSSELLDPLRNQIDRERKHDRGVFLHADFRQRL